MAIQMGQINYGISMESDSMLHICFDAPTSGGGNEVDQGDTIHTIILIFFTTAIQAGALDAEPHPTMLSFIELSLMSLEISRQHIL